MDCEESDRVGVNQFSGDVCDPEDLDPGGYHFFLTTCDTVLLDPHPDLLPIVFRDLVTPTLPFGPLP